MATSKLTTADAGASARNKINAAFDGLDNAALRVTNLEFRIATDESFIGTALTQAAQALSATGRVNNNPPAFRYQDGMLQVRAFGSDWTDIIGRLDLQGPAGPNGLAIDTLIRPGDGPAAFTPSLDGGDPRDLPPLTALPMATPSGRVAPISDGGVVSMRGGLAVEPDHRYRLRYAVRRMVDPADPDGDAVRIAIRWLGQDRLPIAGVADTVVDDILDLAVSSGRVEGHYIVAGTLGAGIDVLMPDGAAYALGYVKAFGTDQITGVEVLELVDVTAYVEAVLALQPPSSVPALNVRVDALETRQITAQGLASGGGNLKQNITFTVTESSPEQARAGTNGTTSMTPRRVTELVRALAIASRVATVAELQASNFPDHVQFVQTVSYRAGTMHGGGLYAQIAAPTTVEPWHVKDAGNRFWMLIEIGKITPYHFGGIGDGIANDYAACLATIRYCTIYGGGDCEFGTGKWGINQTLVVKNYGDAPLYAQSPLVAQYFSETGRIRMLCSRDKGFKALAPFTGDCVMRWIFDPSDADLGLYFSDVVGLEIDVNGAVADGVAVEFSSGLTFWKPRIYGAGLDRGILWSSGAGITTIYEPQITGKRCIHLIGGGDCVIQFAKLYPTGVAGQLASGFGIVIETGGGATKIERPTIGREDDLVPVGSTQIGIDIRPGDINGGPRHIRIVDPEYNGMNRGCRVIGHASKSTFGIEHIRGASIPSSHWMGEAWASGKNYVAGTPRSYGGEGYRAKVDHLSSAANRPDLSPDTWALIADRIWTGQILYAENVKGLLIEAPEVGAHGAYGLTRAEASLPGIHLKGCEDYQLIGGSFNALRKEALLLEGCTQGLLQPAVIRNVAQDGPTTPIIRLVDTTFTFTVPGEVGQDSAAYGQILVKEEGASSANTGFIMTAFGIATPYSLVGATSRFQSFAGRQAAIPSMAGNETLAETQAKINTILATMRVHDLIAR